jgi:chromate transporter
MIAANGFQALFPLFAAVVPAESVCEPMRLNDLGNLLQVISTFLGLSLFALGGGNTLITEYHHISVDQYCWLTPTQFADLYALAQAAPDPSSMIVGLTFLRTADHH